jgi:hypothetical protein
MPSTVSKGTIESLADRKLFTMRDRDHLSWKGLALDHLRRIFATLGAVVPATERRSFPAIGDKEKPVSHLFE